MAKYFVNVVMSTCVEIEVEAGNDAEARALALEEAEPIMADEWDYDIDCVFRDDERDEEDEEEW